MIKEIARRVMGIGTKPPKDPRLRIPNNPPLVKIMGLPVGRLTKEIPAGEFNQALEQLRETVLHTSYVGPRVFQVRRRIP